MVQSSKHTVYTYHLIFYYMSPFGSPESLQPNSGDEAPEGDDDNSHEQSPHDSKESAEQSEVRKETPNKIIESPKDYLSSETLEKIKENKESQDNGDQPSNSSDVTE